LALGLHALAGSFSNLNSGVTLLESGPQMHDLVRQDRHERLGGLRVLPELGEDLPISGTRPLACDTIRRR
jgi:hypothetical protein